jgi:hypothetical protein
MKSKVPLLIFVICILAQGLILPASAADKKPKLVLQITVDQLLRRFRLLISKVSGLL